MNFVRLAAITLIVFLASVGFSEIRDLDELVLIQLKNAGANLSKPHQMQFFLYFPNETLARQAGTHVREKGFGVEIKQNIRKKHWLCLATKTMLPELTALQRIRREFNALADSLGGEYDGWGTEAEK